MDEGKIMLPSIPVYRIPVPCMYAGHFDRYRKHMDDGKKMLPCILVILTGIQGIRDQSLITAVWSVLAVSYAGHVSCNGGFGHYTRHRYTVKCLV